MFSASYALISVILISMLQRRTRMSLKAILDTMVLGAKHSLVIGSIAGSIGIIIAIVGLTGLGLRFSEFIVSLSGGNQFIAIVFVIFASFILGMGLPTTPAYIIIAIFAGPSLADFGVPLLTAHLLMIWYSIDSSISPPVALTAYTASGIAHSNPIKTMWTAFKYAKGLYIIPFLFLYKPQILLMGSIEAIVEAIISAGLGLISSVFFLEGFILRRISIFERLCYAICAFALFYNYWVWNLCGFMGFILLLGFHRVMNRQGEGIENPNGIRPNKPVEIEKRMKTELALSEDQDS